MSSCVTVTNTLVDSRIAAFGYGGESEIYYLVCVLDRVVCNGRYPSLSIGTFNVLVVVIASVFDCLCDAVLPLQYSALSFLRGTRPLSNL